MKKFEPPVCEIIIFAANDVLTTSDKGKDGDTPEVGGENG